jgi:GNAT superfamily N-acetyltransferase
MNRLWESVSSPPDIEHSERAPYVVSTDPARLDAAAVHEFLTSSYWADGLSLDLVRRSLEASLCFGLYAPSGQVGLVRVITDRATFAYLCDVYVLPAHRGRGLGRWLMRCVLGSRQLQGLRRWMLVTRDAHKPRTHHGDRPPGAVPGRSGVSMRCARSPGQVIPRVHPLGGVALMTDIARQEHLVRRIHRLEHRQRVLEPLAGLAFLAMAGALAAFTSRDPEAVRAQRVDLIDGRGERQASLAADSLGAVLTLYDASGRATASLSFNADPRLTLLSGAGREVARLGAPRVQQLVR